MWRTFVRSGRLGSGHLVLHADARENPVGKNGVMTETHFSKFWDLLLHEAHLGDSSSFSNFPPSKMENFAPVCSVK